MVTHLSAPLSFLSCCCCFFFNLPGSPPSLPPSLSWLNTLGRRRAHWSLCTSPPPGNTLVAFYRMELLKVGILFLGFASCCGRTVPFDEVGQVVFFSSAPVVNSRSIALFVYFFKQSSSCCFSAKSCIPRPLHPSNAPALVLFPRQRQASVILRRTSSAACSAEVVHNHPIVSVRTAKICRVELVHSLSFSSSLGLLLL